MISYFKSSCASAKDTLNCLRKVDVDVLQAANTEINNSGFFGTFVFVPVVDGTFITERPTQLLKQGKVNGVRHLSAIVLCISWGLINFLRQKVLLANTNTFEGALFVNQSTADTVRIPDYVSQLFPNFSPSEIKQAAAIYSGLGSNIFQAIAIMGECMYHFIVDMYHFLEPNLPPQLYLFARHMLCSAHLVEKRSRYALYFAVLMFFFRAHMLRFTSTGRICDPARWAWGRYSVLLPDVSDGMTSHL